MRCPKCYSEEVEEQKRWTIKSPKSGAECTFIIIYCEVCKKNRRIIE